MFTAQVKHYSKEEKEKPEHMCTEVIRNKWLSKC